MSESVDGRISEAVAAAVALGESWVGFDHSHAYGDALLTALAPIVGCYLCQPDNPGASDEGCPACARDFWSGR